MSIKDDQGVRELFAENAQDSQLYDLEKEAS